MEGLNIDATFELLSLTLTVTTLFLSAWVVKVFGRASMLTAVKIYRRREYTGADVLILGITIGFIGAFFDNAYWGIVWSSKFFGLGSTETLFNHGVYANVPFRQGAGIVAATLHLWTHFSKDKPGILTYAAIWAITAIAGASFLLAHLGVI